MQDHPGRARMRFSNFYDIQQCRVHSE